MNDPDPSSSPAAAPGAAASKNSDSGKDGHKPPFWNRIRALLTNRSASLRDDLAEALEETGPAFLGSFSANERALLQNVLKLGEMRVEDVMVPRPDIEAVETTDNIAELILAFRAAGHSRLPVYEDNLDNIIGFVHIKDVLERLAVAVPAKSNGKAAPDAATGTGEAGDREAGSEAGKETAKETSKSAPLPVKLQSSVLRRKVGNKDLLRTVLFVPPSMPVGDLLQQMQLTRVHMAIVVDEYGGTDGLVTIEDLLEAVVGDIEDEYDEDDGPLVRKIADNTFVADARAELEEVRALIGPDFDPGAHAENVDTLGGLVFDLIDRVPVRGEVISKLKGFEFEILSAGPRRIKRMRIVRIKRPVRGQARPAIRTEGAKPPQMSPGPQNDQDTQNAAE